MYGFRDRRPSPALAIALVALFIALGSAAYAAVTVPANSIGTKQLKRGAVTASKLADGSVTSDKVKDGSLLAKDFGAGQLLTGPRGPQGLPGPKGDTGAAEAPGVTETIVVRQDMAFPAGGSGELVPMCPPGSYVTGGGYSSSVSLTDYVWDEFPVAGASTPNSGDHPTGWEVGFRNPASASVVMSAYAVCAGG